MGKDYKVLASYGHVRDLPSKNGSVDPENNFKMEWELDTFSKKYVKDEAIAKSNKAGMWSGNFIVPWKWRRIKNKKVR